MGFANAWGDSPRNRLLDFLGDHPASDYSITEMSEFTGISRPTIYAVVSEISGLGYLIETRTLGRSRMFKLNTAHELISGVLRQDILAAAEVETPRPLAGKRR